MVRILKKKGGGTRFPILRLVQVVVVGILCVYVSVLLRGPMDVVASAPKNRERKAELVSDANKAPDANNNDGNQQKNILSGDATTTIAYAVSITGCGGDQTSLMDSAAVLKHSIHLTSIHGNMGGRYDYKMYAIYHPVAASCAQTLAPLGYELLERETPIKVSEIQGDFLRSKIEQNGCCGEKELIKLEAYTLTQHGASQFLVDGVTLFVHDVANEIEYFLTHYTFLPSLFLAAVVHLDLDVLVLQPIDALFDVITKGKSSDYDLSQFIKVQWPDKPFPDKVDAFLTRDYNMHPPGGKYPLVQGGFLVIRPDMKIYQEFVEIVKEGDYRQNGGWGGLVGRGYGGMTIQGLLPYFYDILHPDTFVELNHCVWNQMCINPR